MSKIGAVLSGETGTAHFNTERDVNEDEERAFGVCKIYRKYRMNSGNISHYTSPIQLKPSTTS